MTALAPAPFLFARADMRREALAQLCRGPALARLGERWNNFVVAESRTSGRRLVALYDWLCSQLGLADIGLVSPDRARLALNMGYIRRGFSRAVGLACLSHSLPAVLDRARAARMTRDYGAFAVANALAHRARAPKRIVCGLSPDLAEAQGEAAFRHWLESSDEAAAGWWRILGPATDADALHAAFDPALLALVGETYDAWRAGPGYRKEAALGDHS